MDTAKLLIWEDATNNSSNMTELGKTFQVFAGCQYFPVKKDNGKKAVIMFKNPEGKSITVVLATRVDKLLRDKVMDISQILSLPVFRSERLTRKDEQGVEVVITDKPTFWINLPVGWKDLNGGVTELTAQRLEELIAI